MRMKLSLHAVEQVVAGEKGKQLVVPEVGSAEVKTGEVPPLLAAAEIAGAAVSGWLLGQAKVDVKMQRRAWTTHSLSWPM